MWNYIKLNNKEFADLAVLLDTFKTDNAKYKQVAQSGVTVLVLSKIVKGGKHHQVIFSPNSYEILSDIDSRFLEFKTDLIPQPGNIGTGDGFLYLYGDKVFYEFLKSKSQINLFQ
jgi:hypothetical protein